MAGPHGHRNPRGGQRAADARAARGAPLSITGLRFGNPDRLRASYLNPKAADYAGAGYVKFAEWVEAGWGCFACHSTHSTGQIPADSQIDLDRSRKASLTMSFFRSLLETTLSLGGKLASAPSSRQQKAQEAIDFMEKEVEKANGKQAVNMRTLGAMVARDAEGNEVVVVASGKRDVSEAVQAVAEAEGYQVARLPGADAEETLGLYADQDKLTPLLMKTNQISCDVCSLVMPESGGVLQPGRATWEWPAGSWEP